MGSDEKDTPRPPCGRCGGRLVTADDSQYGEIWHCTSCGQDYADG